MMRFGLGGLSSIMLILCEHSITVKQAICLAGRWPPAYVP